MSVVERAKMLRGTMEELATNLDDNAATENIELFPTWNGSGTQYIVNQRLRYNGVLFRVLQAHTSQPDWTPENAASLFARVLPGQDGVSIGEWEQPDSTNPYMIGDKVVFNGKIYESTIDNNVWSPAAYPAGWKEAP